MKPGIIYFIILLLSFFYGCSDTEPTNSAWQDPFIQISNPIMSTNVPDTTTVRITSNVNDLVRVELYIDQNIPSQAAVFQQPPYEYLWNTRYYEDGSQHVLQAKGYDRGGNQLDSKYVIVNVFRFMPDNLQAFIRADSLIELQWNDNCSYETGFEIEEALDDSNFVKIADVDSNTTHYNMPGFFNLFQTYNFRVRAVSENDTSGYSNIAAAELKLNVPVNLDINFLSDTAAVLSWTDNNQFETGYVIEKSVPGYGNVFVKRLPYNSTQTVIEAQFISGTYVNYLLYPEFHGVYGEPAFFPYKTISFPAPFDVTLEGNSDNSLTLAWSDINDYELGFIIERSENGYTYTEIGRTTDHSFVDTDPDTSLHYSYRIAAYSHYNTAYSPKIYAVYSSKLNQIGKMPVINSITWAALSYDASIIALGGYSSVDADIYLYHTFTGQQFRILYSADNSSYAFKHITISPDNKLVAAAGANKYITVWDINTGGVVKRINNQIYPEVLQFSRDGNYLIVGYGSKLRFYDLQTWQYETRVTSFYNITMMDVNYYETVIATGDGYDNIKIWDYNTGSLINEIPESITASPLKLNRTGSRLYSVIDNQLFVWDVASPSVINNIWNFGRCSYIAVNESRNIIVGADNLCNLKIWDLNTGYLTGQITSSIGFHELFFTPDGNHLIGREYTQYYYIWSVERGWMSALP